MSGGTGSLIMRLGIASLLMVLLAAAIVIVSGLGQDPDSPLNFIEAAWISLMRTLDAGNLSADTNWGMRLIMLSVTIGGIFIVGTLITILNNGLQSKLEDLNKGRSVVIEKGHTLVLGWSPKIFTIISELRIANENVKDPSIVILSELGKDEMHHEIKKKLPKNGHTKIICRSGNPTNQNDLEIVNFNEARSIIILPPETGQQDIFVIKSLLAITNNKKRRDENFHIVAAIEDPANEHVSNIAGKGEAVIVCAEEFVSRIMAQTCYQSGLSIIYEELLDFDGCEIYFKNEQVLTGKNYKEAVNSYETSAVIGIRRYTGEILLNPPMDTLIHKDDSVIVISEDDDTIYLSDEDEKSKPDESVIVNSANRETIPKDSRTLILGWNKKGDNILKELDEYLPDGTEINIVTRNTEIDKSGFRRIKIDISTGDKTDRKMLESLDIPSYNHLIILSSEDGSTSDEADARTLISLLHIRDICGENAGMNIVTEMLDHKNTEIAEITKADDFIVSDRLISLMLSQLSENKELNLVFKDLFDAEGNEIYLKPVSGYVKTGRPVSFYTVTEAAARQSHTAIGYRIKRDYKDPDRSYGVNINPKKSDLITFEEEDKIIVLSEN
jgi:Trk K+ transport system NAD-binding subunit